MLSAQELALVKNVDWLLTKNTIIGKVYALFGELAEEIDIIRDKDLFSLPAEIWSTPAKISRGENYRGLPYLILDYPRKFSVNDVLAIRTMFWWGNFISITLHLKGIYKDMFLPAIKKNIAGLVQQEVYISIDDDEWRHDFETDNYRKLSDAESEADEHSIEDKDFCKLAVRIPLEEWNEAKQKITGYYGLFFASLQD